MYDLDFKQKEYVAVLVSFTGGCAHHLGIWRNSGISRGFSDLNFSVI